MVTGEAWGANADRYVQGSQGAVGTIQAKVRARIGAAAAALIFGSFVLLQTQGLDVDGLRGRLL